MNASRDRLPTVIFAMMVVGGFTAANAHYAPPLLPSMATAFHVQAARLSLLPAAAQAGLAVGLLIILPLADMVERRRLLVTVLVFLAFAAFLTGAASNLTMLFASAFLLGLGCVSAQLLTPYAALVAPPHRQGEAVGIVLSGILCGAFASKVIAGFAGALWGWRSPYLLSSAVMAGAAVAMARSLPESTPEPRMRYGELLGSLVQLVRQEPNLRQHAMNGALSSGAVTAFWGVYALHLLRTFGYGTAIAGLFGLVGIAGTVGASFAGRQVDSGGFGSLCLAAAALLSGGFACLWGGAGNLLLFTLGVLAIDAGAGLNHAANQGAAFTLRPQARGRINSIYMASYFLGGTIGTASGALLYELYGWGAVCGLGMLAGLVVAVMQMLRPLSPRRHAQSGMSPLETATEAVQPL